MMMKTVIVAPYWNVNFKNNDFELPDLQVIVAPYWNVNLLDIDTFLISQEVIVAPYWNVNIELFVLFSSLG